MKKLNNNRGFSLTETLAAILILLMVAGIVAGGIPVAAKAYTAVVDAANGEMKLSTAMVRLRTELTAATRVELSADGKTLSYLSGERGVRSSITIGDDGALMLSEYADAADSARPVLSYDSGAEGIAVSCGAINYSGGCVTFTNLTAKKGGNTLSSHEKYTIRVIAG